MAARVITIARAAGAGGEAIGQAVAAQLGFRCVDDEIIARAAEGAGLTRQAVEEQEHSRTLVARIFAAMNSALASEQQTRLPRADSWDDPESAYRRLLLDVIKETAAAGQVVIVAHGASIYLAGMAGLLRVFITASLETRAARVAAARGLDAAQARRQIDHSDHERRAYLERFYHIHDEAPTHYDLVINTDQLSPELATQAIVAVASARLRD